MDKETRYRQHPVRMENGLFLGSPQVDVLGLRLDLQDDVLTSAVNQSSTPARIWQELILSGLITVPADAVAIVISVEVNDAASAANITYMGFCPTGRAMAGRCQYVYPSSAALVDDEKGSRIIIVEIDPTSPSIGYKIAASVAGFDYSITLIGWLIGGTRVSRLTIPAEDLLCKLSVYNP